MGTFLSNARLRFLWRVGLAVIIGTVLVTIIISLLLEREANSLSDMGLASGLGDAGEFLNLKYGVPVAFLGAVVGLIIAAVGYAFTSQQNEIDILRFVEEKALQSNEKYLALRRLMQRIVMGGNAIMHDIHEYEASQGEEPLSDDERQKARLELEGRLESTIATIRGLLSPDVSVSDPSGVTLRELAEQIQADCYTAYFVREQKAGLRPESPLGYLRTRLPAAAAASISRYLSDELDDVARNLDLLARGARAEHGVGAFKQMPFDALTIDVMGAMIASYGVYAAPSTQAVDGRAIRGYIFNIGAAYLLEIYDLLPDNASIVIAFNKIFGDRSEVATKFLEEAGPDRSRLASPIWHQSFSAQLENLDRLIIVDFEQGANEFYDPQRHGPLRMKNDNPA